MKPDYVLGLRTEDYLERRLQSQVFFILFCSHNQLADSKKENFSDKMYWISFVYICFQVFKLGLAKSIHHARVLIRQKDIRYVFFKC